MKYSLVLPLLGACLFAQVSSHGSISVAGATQDASGAAHTLPLKVIANAGVLFGTCTIGELVFVTAAAPGQQIYECSATNTWTQQVNSGGGGALNGTRTASGTTDTILSTDTGKLVIYTNAGNVAVTLPQATGSFTSPFAFFFSNQGGGIVTITPTTSTINSAASVACSAVQGMSIWSDGTNYHSSGACVSGGSGIAISSTGAIATDATIPTKSTVQLSTPNIVTLTSASGSTLTGTMNPTLGAYGDLQIITFRWNQACSSGAKTIQVDGITSPSSAISLFLSDGAANLLTTNCASGQLNTFQYDGVNHLFRLIGGG